MNPTRPACLHSIVGFFLSAVLLLGFVSPALAAQTETAGPAPPAAGDYALTLQRLQTTAAAEKENLEGLRRQTEALAQLTEVYASAINAWRIQAATYSSLMALPEPKLNNLTKALGDLQSSLESVQNKIDSVSEKLTEIRGLQAEIQKQTDSYKQNLTAMAEDTSSSGFAHQLRAELEGLIQVITDKREALDQLETYHANLFNELNLIQTEFTTLVTQLEEKIRKVRTQSLFERSLYTWDHPVQTVWNDFVSEIGTLGEQIQRWDTPTFWIEQLSPIWRGSGPVTVTVVLLYGAWLILLFKLKRLVNAWRQAEIWADSPAWRIILLLLSRSLLLAGSIGFIYLYSGIRGIYTETPILRAMANGLWIVLCTRWFLSLIKIGALADPPRIPKKARHQLQALLGVIRYGAIVLVGLTWLLAEAAILPALIRLLLEIALIIYLLTLRSTLKGFYRPEHFVLAPRLEVYQPAIRGVLWAIPGIAVILETLGYGALALYWLAASGRSLTVIIWAALFYFALTEWNQKFYRREPSPQEKQAQPVKWLLCRVYWLAWGTALALALVLSWGDPKAVFKDVWTILSYTIAIGDLKINFIHLFKAFLIVFFTHLLVRVGRYILQSKVLDQSGLEIGLRASIVTMSVYVAWGLGILAALYALGLSGTSLTVAFGALSIGLGFGLQNIFNNFISGIIMLFERPIQVGDAIEIHGTWGEVKKINFRSTVVQTYDNSSLIIPNSDFISNQVTNWSFRDQSLRIKVNVGVAYGSDIERVREILLEVAGRTPNVRKYPQPDVLFADFADSSLNFVLRAWTDIDNMLKAATAIRFAIDRAFREEGIEIAFPQRDIHIRSSISTQPKENATSELTPEPAGGREQ
ncbi:MAG: mechanosensitive ion channel domain-containing protein [Desulfobacterales bacterium]